MRDAILIIAGLCTVATTVYTFYTVYEWRKKAAAGELFQIRF